MLRTLGREARADGRTFAAWGYAVQRRLRKRLDNAKIGIDGEDQRWLYAPR